MSFYNIILNLSTHLFLNLPNQAMPTLRLPMPNLVLGV